MMESEKTNLAETRTQPFPEGKTCCLTTAPEDETKELWDLYRLGKCYPCSSDILQHCTERAPAKRIGKQYDLGEQATRKEPRPGSSYWVETFDPPPYFQQALQGDQIVMALKEGRGKRKFRKRGKYNRKSH